MSRVYYTKSRGAHGPSRVFLATPVYEKTAASHDSSIVASLPLLDEAGIGWERFVLAENCHVDDARNGILRDFLMTECTDLVFLDADVCWQPEDLVKLCRHDRDIVGGVYPKRHPKGEEEYPVLVAPGTTLQADADGLVEVDGLPTGFMKIKRHVVEKMIERNKHRQFPRQGHKEGDPLFTVVFERTFERRAGGRGMRWGGDYDFCKNWRAMGGKLYADPRFILGHEVSMTIWGNLGEYWRKIHGVAEKINDQNFAKALKMLDCDEPDPQAYVWLHEGWNNDFAMSIEGLAACHALVRKADGLILDCGSGLSSFVMAAANPRATVISLEGDAIWATKMCDALDKFPMPNIKLHYHPLKDGWYCLDTIPKQPYSLVLNDGPRRTHGDRSLLYQRMGKWIEGATVLIDDAADPKQLASLEEWAAKIGGSVSVMGEHRQFAVMAPPAEIALSGAA